MEMKPDEIVVNYRQAKNKGQQIKILADLNLCSIEDILQVLVEHGGYERQRISRAIGAARSAQHDAECAAEWEKLSPQQREEKRNRLKSKKIPYKKKEDTIQEAGDHPGAA